MPYHISRVNAFDFLVITTYLSKRKEKKMKITVQYDPRYIKRMGYEGLTKQEIDKKEIERLQGSKKTYSKTKKK
jgi:hypothetical protein